MSSMVNRTVSDPSHTKVAYIFPLNKNSTENYFKIQAGLTCIETKFYVWEWEEELRKLTLEDVGLGRTKN